ncbi:MAG: ATP-dependent DNA helicase, partial [Myxococcota bacterium]
AAYAGIAAAGKEVFFFAPGAEASRGVLEAEGFTGATTVAKLLRDTSLQERLRGQVIWVDEAGTLGARDMAKLFDVAEAARARVILSGDVHQHAPVARGDALRVLESEAGLRPAELTTVYRQTRTAYREAVEAISRGDERGAREGFERLEAMGAVREVEDESRYTELAGAYLETVLGEGKSALVVSPTHAEGAEVTEAIRQGLRQAGQLGDAERAFTRLKSLGLTEAERGDARSYTHGLVVQSHGHIKGLKPGTPYAVAEVDEDAVWLAAGELSPHAPRIPLPLCEAAKFEVLDRDTVRLAAGDLIRITRNGMAKSRTASGRRQELRNGAQYEVEGFTPAGDLKCVGRDTRGRITSRVVVDRAFGNLTHGYCVTSHAAQGKTVDRVFVAQSAAAFRANTREQFYVSVSRGRESIAVFTDDREALRSQISRSAARMSASEFARARERERSQELQRHARSASRLIEEARAFARRRAAQIMALIASPRRERTYHGPQRGV